MNDQKLKDYLHYFEEDTIKAVLHQIEHVGEIDRMVILLLFDNLLKTVSTVSIFTDKIEGINEHGFAEAVRRYVIAHITGDKLLACLMWVDETEIIHESFTPPVKQSGPEHLLSNALRPSSSYLCHFG